MPVSVLEGFWIFALLVCIGFVVQGQTFSRSGIEYILDLPSPSWRVISRLDVHEHVKFIYEGDSKNGYLRIRRNLVMAGATAEDLFRTTQHQGARKGDPLHWQSRAITFWFRVIRSRGNPGSPDCSQNS